MSGISPGAGALLAFVLGAVIGSFVNVVAFRLPRGISLVRPRSFCPKCERPIPFWANVPIFSYLALRGRCLMCGQPIPFRYPITEAALAIIAVHLFFSFPLAEAVIRFGFVAALFAISWIDLDFRIIPNAITLPGIVVGFVAVSLAVPSVGWKSALIGIAAGVGLLFLSGEIYYLVRGREGIGMGDVWLLGMVGAFTGWPGVFFTLFVGSVIGSIVGLVLALLGMIPQPLREVGGGTRANGEDEARSLLQTAIPFGPFLSLAAGLYCLFQPQLTRWYLSQ